MKHIVSYGGGIDSTAMLIAMKKRGIIPDAILFADTGGEHPETYSYIQYFNMWLLKNGMPQITTVKYKTKHGVELTLEQDILNNHTIPSIAFGWKTCSQKFKIQPQEKWIKEQYPHEEIHHYIGFEFGEQYRMKENPIPNHFNHYPLIEFEMDRNACIREIESEGLCVPPKSSCFYCPNMVKGEILSLSDMLKQRVKAIEKNATVLIELKGLGRTYKWTDLIDADESQHKLFDDLELYRKPCECTT